MIRPFLFILNKARLGGLALRKSYFIYLIILEWNTLTNVKIIFQ
jgi:hypothetical protein